MIRRTSRRAILYAAIVCAGTPGCRDNPAPPAPEVPPAVTVRPVTSDEKVLVVLDFLEPMFKVNTDGRVTHLRLGGRHVPTAILTEVGKLTELQGLDLYGTTVSDEGLAQLKDLQKLRSIGLGATPITDRGLDHLEKLQSLQYVWVPKATVTKSAIEKLKSERPDLNVYLQ
jgi:hypothetical protein